MRIVPEPEHLDARVPLGILGVSIVILLLSALLTLGVRSIASSLQASSAARPRGIATVAPGGVSAVSPVPVEQPPPRAITTTEPAGAGRSSLFERHRAPVPTRELPERLREYGWVDRTQGVVHIPIGRAKQLYLSREGGMRMPVSGHEGRGAP